MVTKGGKIAIVNQPLNLGIGASGFRNIRVESCCVLVSRWFYLALKHGQYAKNRMSLFVCNHNDTNSRCEMIWQDCQCFNQCKYKTAKPSISHCRPTSFPNIGPRVYGRLGDKTIGRQQKPRTPHSILTDCKTVIIMTSGAAAIIWRSQTKLIYLILR